MNSSSALRLPKLKEIHLSKDDSLVLTKPKDGQGLQNLYGSQVKKYQKMLKHMIQEKPEAPGRLKLPDASKPNSKTMASAYEKDRGQEDSFYTNLLDDTKAVNNSKIYNRSQAPSTTTHKNFPKVNSELVLLRNENRKMFSVEQSQTEDLHISSKNFSQVEKEKVVVPQNRIRNGRFFKEASLIRNSSSSTPTKLKPIRDSSLHSMQNVESIVETNEAEETLRKAKTDSKQTPINEAAINNSRFKAKNEQPEYSSEPSKGEKSSQEAPFRTTAYNHGRKLSTPFLETTNKITSDKPLVPNNILNRNLTPSQNQTETIVPSDPEKAAKLNIEKVYNLQVKLLALVNAVQASKPVATLATEYLEMIDANDYFDAETTLLEDEEEKLKLKTCLLIEWLSVWIMLSTELNTLKKEDQISLRQISHITYLNFVTFVDFVMARFVSSNKQHVWHIKFRELREKKAEKVEPLGIYNNRLIAMIKSLAAHLKPGIGVFIETLYPRIRKEPLENIYNSFKTFYEDEIKEWNINVTVIEEEKPPKNPVIDKSSADSNKDSGIKANDSPQKGSYHLPPLKSRENGDSQLVYSLVVDLDETLIHYEENNGRGRFFVRPYAEFFLKEMSQYYEITVFTAAVKDYADIVLNILDKNNYVKHRLYRNHTVFSIETNTFLKDLTKLGRDLNHTIIIDNTPENFRLQEENGIEIKSWYSDPYDCELLDLIPFLKDIVLNKTEDVRVAIKKIKDLKQNPNKTQLRFN